MNHEALSMQPEESAKYQEWVIEFDTDLKVAFDDESEFDDTNDS